MDTAEERRSGNRLLVLEAADNCYRRLFGILQREDLLNGGHFHLDHSHDLDDALCRLACLDYRACLVDEGICQQYGLTDSAWGAGILERMSQSYVQTPLVFMIDAEQLTIGPDEARWMEAGRIRVLSAHNLGWPELQESLGDLIVPHARVLVVHPCEGEYDYMAGVLSRFPDVCFLPEWAASLDEAIEKHRLRHYDVLVVNHDLGREPGSELLSLLEILDARTPAILCTGDGEIELDELALRLVGRRQAQLISMRRARRDPAALARLCAQQIRRN